jgi:hypothetical protein
MNIYQIYEMNNRQFGFYIQHRLWSTKLAMVVNISDLAQGEPLEGEATCFHKGSVLVDYYKASDISGCTDQTPIERMFLSYPCSNDYRLV